MMIIVAIGSVCIGFGIGIMTTLCVGAMFAASMSDNLSEKFLEK